MEISALLQNAQVAVMASAHTFCLFLTANNLMPTHEDLGRLEFAFVVTMFILFHYKSKPHFQNKAGDILMRFISGMNPIMARSFSRGDQGHRLVFNPHGSPVNKLVVEPTILSWQGPLLVFSTNDELFNKAAPVRKALGRRVLYVNPELPDLSASIRILDGIDPDSEAIALRVREVLSWIWSERGELNADGLFWRRWGEQVVIAILQDIVESHPPGKALLSCLIGRINNTEDSVKELLGEIAMGPGKAALTARSCLVSAEDTFSCFRVSSLDALDYLKHPLATDILDGTVGETFTYADIINGRVDVFITVRPELLSMGDAVAKGIVLAILSEISRRGERLKYPLLAAVDSAPLLKADFTERLAHSLPNLRHLNVAALLCSQSQEQAEQYWGAAATKSIASLCSEKPMSAKEELRAVATPSFPNSWVHGDRQEPVYYEVAHATTTAAKPKLALVVVSVVLLLAMILLLALGSPRSDSPLGPPPASPSTINPFDLDRQPPPFPSSPTPGAITPPLPAPLPATVPLH